MTYDLTWGRVHDDLFREVGPIAIDSAMIDFIFKDVRVGLFGGVG